jgi:antitoxin component YwqK of YwqJK toxin-antitoxin module
MRLFGKAVIVIIGVFLFSCSDKISPTTTPDNYVTIADSDSIVVFSILGDSKKVKTDLRKRYHYYIRNTINSAQGSYVGKPLDGRYSAVSRDNVLVRKGTFSNGLYHGTWIKWHSNGNIEEIYHWKKGMRSGKFKRYFVNGKVRTAGRYKNDRRTGVVKNYDVSGYVTKDKYRQGRLKTSVSKTTKDSTATKIVKRKPKESSSVKQEQNTSNVEAQISPESTKHKDQKNIGRDNTPLPSTEKGKSPNDNEVRKKRSLINKSSNGGNQKTNE